MSTVWESSRSLARYRRLRHTAGPAPCPPGDKPCLVVRPLSRLSLLEPGLGGKQSGGPASRLDELLGDLGVGRLGLPILGLVDGPGLGHDPIDLGADPVRAAVGSLRGVGLDPGGVKRHEAHLDQPALSGKAQHLIEQLGELALVITDESGDRGVVGALVGCDEPKGDVLGAAPLDQARGTRPGRVGVDQQRHHHLRVVGRPAPPVGSAACVERRQVQRLHDVDDEPREVVPGKPLVQARRQQEGLVSVAGNEVVGHGSSERRKDYVHVILSNDPSGGELIRGFRETL